MGCPKFLAGSYLPTLAGAWGVDLCGEPHGIRQNQGFPWATGNQIPSSPVPAPVCPFVSLLWPSPPVGAGGLHTWP